MRNFVITAALLVAMATSARAEDIAGSYDVKFEEMGHNCNPPPVALGRGKLTITTFPKKNALSVNIETIPVMDGIPQKGGKINAKTAKVLPTTVQGLDAKYSIAGKIDDSGILQLVLVAEYVKHDDKKPYCTQSWNVTGAKGTPEAGDKPAKPDKKK
jgi:hypothetical protein